MGATGKATTCLLVFFLTVSFEMRATALERALHIRGELVSYIHPAETNGRPFITAKFSVMLLNCAWRVEMTEMKYHHPQGQGPLAIEYSGDCESTYVVTTWDEAAIQNSKEEFSKRNPGAAKRAIDGGNKPATAFPGNHPSKLQYTEIAPWLAFAGGRFLQTSESDTVTNIFLRTEWPHDRLRFEYETNASSQAFPASIRLFNRTTRGHPKDQAKNATESKPTEPEFLGMEHSVTSWANWEGKPVPAAFEQKYFVPRFRSQTDELRVAAIIIGRTTAIEEIDAPPTLVPQFGPKTMIYDDRFEGRRVLYKASQYGWLDKKDPKLQKKLSAIRNSNIEPAARPVNPFAFIIIVLAIILPLVIWKTRK